MRMMKLIDIESDSKGENPVEEVKKYNMFVLNHVEKLVNIPFSPLNCRIPGKAQVKFSGSGLLVDIGLKDGKTMIPVKFWIRHSYAQLRDYPRLHLSKNMESCEDLYKFCSKHDIHFCVIALNNGMLSSFWIDRYDFIPFEKYKLEARWDRIDRMGTPWSVQKGQMKHVGYNFANLYDRFEELILAQERKESIHGD